MPPDPTDPSDPIRSSRLELVLVPPAVLAAIDASPETPAAWPGVGDLDAVLTRSLPAGIRLRQVDADPSVAPWLVRGIVVPDRSSATGRSVIGHLGGHDRPDAEGMVEIGYTLTPAARGRGLATEAATAWFAWAHARCARTAHLSIEPRNHASNAVARRLGLREGHRVWDQDDAVWETIWSSPLPLSIPPVRVLER